MSKSKNLNEWLKADSNRLSAKPKLNEDRTLRRGGLRPNVSDSNNLSVYKRRGKEALDKLKSSWLNFNEVIINNLSYDCNEFINEPETRELMKDSFAELSLDELAISDWCDAVSDALDRWTPGNWLGESFKKRHLKEGVAGLPKKAIIPIDKLYLDNEEEVEEPYFGDIVCDYLSDEYGFCVNHCSFDIKYLKDDEGEKHPQTVVVYKIDWDVSESVSLKETRGRQQPKSDFQIAVEKSLSEKDLLKEVSEKAISKIVSIYYDVFEVEESELLADNVSVEKFTDEIYDYINEIGIGAFVLENAKELGQRYVNELGVLDKDLVEITKGICERENWLVDNEGVPLKQHFRPEDYLSIVIDVTGDSKSDEDFLRYNIREVSDVYLKLKEKEKESKED